MEFTALVSRSLTDLFVREMEGKILSGELAVGEQLPNERELSEKFKVSRAVVNNGIKRLVDLGFVKVSPRKGAYVQDYQRYGRVETLAAVIAYNGGLYSPQMLDDLFEVRENLERGMAAAAARNRTDADLDTMRRELRRLREIFDPPEFSRAFFGFFHLIAAASKNMIYPLLLQTMAPLYPPISEAILRKCNKEERMKMLDDLVEYIAQKDEDAAKENISESIRWGAAILKNNYRPGEPLLKDT
jgi:DNA-binding FadR family transcriptional regulator